MPGTSAVSGWQPSTGINYDPAEACRNCVADFPNENNPHLELQLFSISVFLFRF